PHYINFSNCSSHHKEEKLTSAFSQQIIVSKLTSPQTQYRGSSGSISSPAASSSALNSSSLPFPSAVFFYVAFIFPVALKLFVVGDKFRPARGKDLNALNMNYTCLIYGGVMSLTLLWYAVDARKWFKGPKINVEHLIHTQVIDGQETDHDQTDEFAMEKKA
ncbi:MAG: hypothetical protein LQ347_004725, partial [Umbilicaria vellea]